ncbi:MAG: helicase HerA-like domain-containing protein [Pseudomonadota bacterium]
MSDPILLARHAGNSTHLLPAMANRHGLIAGATGTGKTISLRVLAEAFSRRGVPVFMADVKGDLTGMAAAGGDNPKIAARAQELAIDGWKPEGFPVAFWDLWAEQGTPVRATVADFGPLLLGRVLELNETQAGVLTLVFKVAADEKQLLLDLRDLRGMLAHVAANAAQYQTSYGNVAAASVGAIQRALLALEQQGADRFFGEPALALADFMQQRDGKGVINILAADRLLASPRLYATFLLWMLNELFETLPEAGDLAQPKLVFFFDEAHLLFNDAPKALVDRIEQVVRLIRSKGVGVYFVTQNPIDIPETVLGQLGNRVQHALRAFSPREQKAVKAAAETFRPNPAVDVAQAITELGVGEALVSVLDAKGTPTMVERALIVPPVSRIVPLAPAEKAALVAASPLHAKYLQTVDRESAHEVLQKRLAQRDAQADSEASLRRAPAEDGAGPAGKAAAGGVLAMLGGGFVWLLKTVLRTIGYQIARDIARRALGRGAVGARRRR